MVADRHQRSLLIVATDSARGVGKNHGANTHAPKHPHGKRYLLYRIALVEMHASLHRRHGNLANFADDHLPSMPNRGRSRERRNVRVGNSCSFRKLIGKTAKPRAQYQPDPWAKRSL